MHVLDICVCQIHKYTMYTYTHIRTTHSHKTYSGMCVHTHTQSTHTNRIMCIRKQWRIEITTMPTAKVIGYLVHRSTLGQGLY